MIDAIIFDMDGTLVDTEAVISDCIAKWLGSRGFEMSGDQKGYVIGRAWSDIWTKLASELALPFSRDEAEEGILNLKDEVVDREGLVILPGAVEAVKTLSRRWPVTIVSGSTRREIEDIVTRLDIHGEITVFTGCEDYGDGKPAPDAFLTGADRLGVEAGRCLVFEDSVAGIAAAKAAGMFCVAVEVGNFDGQDQSQADVVIPTLEGVDPKWVLNLDIAA